MIPGYGEGYAASTQLGSTGNYYNDAYQLKMAGESDAGIPWKEAAKYTDIVWAKSADNNNGSYQNNQLQMQTGDVNSFVVWKYAYIAIPVVIVATVVTPSQNVSFYQNPQTNGLYQQPIGSPYSVGFKSGAWQLVDSCILTFCGKTINSQNRFTNALAHFRALTETSPDALKVIARSWQFYPDSFDSQTLGLTNTNTNNSYTTAGGYLNNTVVSNGPAMSGGFYTLAMVAGVQSASIPLWASGTQNCLFLTNAQMQYPISFTLKQAQNSASTAYSYICFPPMKGTGGTNQFPAVYQTLSANAFISVQLAAITTSGTAVFNVGQWGQNPAVPNGGYPPALSTTLQFTATVPVIGNCIQVIYTGTTMTTETVTVQIWEPSLSAPFLLPSSNVNPVTGNINIGLLERCKYWAYSNPLGLGPGAAPNMMAEFREGFTPGPGGTGSNTAGPVYGTPAAAAVTTSIQLYRAIIKLPLMFLADVFDQLDYPVAGTNWNMTFVLNQVQSSLLTACGPGIQAACSATQFLSGGLTCPIMVTNVGCAQNSAVAAVVGTPTAGNYPSFGMASGAITSVSLYVGNAPGFNPGGTGSTQAVTGYQIGGGPQAFLNQCFLYYPVVGLPFNPLARITSDITSSVYERKVRYLDHMWIPSPNVYQPNQPAQWFITSDVVGLQYLLIMPFIDVSSMAGASSGPSATGPDGVSRSEQVTPYSSCTSSEPGTMSAQASIINFSIMVDDFNYFVNPLVYTYETWLHAVRQFLPNDAQDTIIAAGLIDQHAWENGYRVYAFDLSRAPVAKRAGKLFFNFTNNSPYNIQLHALPIASRRMQMTYTAGAKGPAVQIYQGDY